MGIIGTKYTPEELAEFLEDMAGLDDMSDKMENLYFDERLVSTLRGLAYLEILDKEGMPAVKERIITQIAGFYDEYSLLLEEEPSSEQEKTVINVVKRIQEKLHSLGMIEDSEPNDADNPVNSPENPKNHTDD